MSYLYSIFICRPENVHRLYDLIRIEDDRVRNAFYFSLRNTLVANDLDQAKRIAYGAQRYRVVSLQGDLIELSGVFINPVVSSCNDLSILRYYEWWRK